MRLLALLIGLLFPCIACAFTWDLQTLGGEHLQKTGVGKFPVTSPSGWSCALELDPIQDSGSGFAQYGEISCASKGTKVSALLLAVGSAGQTTLMLTSGGKRFVYNLTVR